MWSISCSGTRKFLVGYIIDEMQIYIYRCVHINMHIRMIDEVQIYIYRHNKDADVCIYDSRDADVYITARCEDSFINKVSLFGCGCFCWVSLLRGES